MNQNRWSYNFIFDAYLRNVYKSFRKPLEFGQRDLRDSFIIILLIFLQGSADGGIGEGTSRNRT